MLSLAALGQAQSNDPLLDKVREQVSKSILRLPNYLCTQTIQRTQMDPVVRNRLTCAQLAGLKQSARLLNSKDRLRLDVAMGEKKEMYSWMGSNQFFDSNIVELVHFGPISSGSFNGFLRAVFTRNIATYAPPQQVIRDGRTLAEYGFSVPQESKSYQYLSPSRELFYTAYGGTFLVDSKSGELVELNIQTKKEPGDPGACEQDTSLKYSQVELNGQEFLLPEESALRIYHPDGVLTENRTVYSACHVFLGESKISFEEPGVSASKKAPAEPAEIAVPGGLAFTIVVDKDVRLESLYGGDPITAQLKAPIVNQRGKTLVPTGATIVLRVMRVLEIGNPTPYSKMTLVLEQMTTKGRKVRLIAGPSRHSITSKESPKAPGLVLIMPDANFSKNSNVIAAELTFATKITPKTGIGKGFEMTWTTSTP